MSIAFGALIILLLVFPGISFRTAYLHGPYSIKNISFSIIDELFFSIIPAFIFQVLGLLVMEYVFRVDVQIGLFYKLISGAPFDAFGNKEFHSMENFLPVFLIYTLALIAISVFLGRLIRSLVEKFNWDMKIHALRFNNDWYYLFSGRLLDFEDVDGESKEVDLIQVDVVTESKEGSHIYVGILHNFYLSKDGLDRIYLKNVYRRKLDQDKVSGSEQELSEKEFDDRYYKMPGSFFVIPYSEIKNINVSYFKVEEE